MEASANPAIQALVRQARSDAAAFATEAIIWNGITAVLGDVFADTWSRRGRLHRR